MANSSTAKAGAKATAGTTSTTNAEEVMLFNVTDMPCVYTNDGRILGGGERRWVPYAHVDSMTYYVIAQGWIIVKRGTLPALPAAEAGPAEAEQQAPQEEKTGESAPV